MDDPLKNHSSSQIQLCWIYLEPGLLRWDVIFISYPEHYDMTLVTWLHACARMSQQLSLFNELVVQETNRGNTKVIRVSLSHATFNSIY